MEVLMTIPRLTTAARTLPVPTSTATKQGDAEAGPVAAMRPMVRLNGPADSIGLTIDHWQRNRQVRTAASFDLAKPAIGSSCRCAPVRGLPAMRSASLAVPSGREPKGEDSSQNSTPEPSPREAKCALQMPSHASMPAYAAQEARERVHLLEPLAPGDHALAAHVRSPAA